MGVQQNIRIFGGVENLCVILHIFPDQLVQGLGQAVNELISGHGPDCAVKCAVHRMKCFKFPAVQDTLHVLIQLVKAINFLVKVRLVEGCVDTTQFHIIAE